MINFQCVYFKTNGDKEIFSIDCKNSKDKKAYKKFNKILKKEKPFHFVRRCDADFATEFFNNCNNDFDFYDSFKTGKYYIVYNNEVMTTEKAIGQKIKSYKNNK